jgi:YD repeat-containing protein
MTYLLYALLALVMATGGCATLCAGQSGVVRLQSGFLSKGLPGFDPMYEPTKFKYTSPEGMVFVVEENKGVLSMADRNENTLTFTDTAITHSNGMAVTISRDAQKRITAITDPAGEQMLYGYNAAGRLISFTDRTGAVTQFKYENAAYPHYLTEIIDPLGHRAVKSIFDADGRLIGQQDADGNTISMTHDLANRKETTTDRLGHPTTHEYDLNGNIIKTTDALGGITTRTYDARDRELTVTDPLGHTTSRTYDANDNVLTETNALGHTTHYTYNDKKQPLSITDPMGRVTTFSYDANGNSTSIIDPTGRSTSFTYDGNGSVTSLIMPGDTAYHFTLDPASGEKLSQTIVGADGQISAHQTFTYDANGEQTGTTDYLVPPGATDVTAATVVKTTAQVFDPEGRMTSMAIRDAAGNPIVTQSWTYNANGDELSHTDPLGRVTSTEYDSQGRDFLTTHPDGTTSLLVYDANGEITSTTNRSGHLMSYEIDALGRQTKATNLADGTFTTTVYDPAGRELSKTDELGRTSTMAYDPANRLISSTDSAGNTISMTYDDAGRQITETDADGHTTTTEYDAAGRPLKTIAPDGNFVLSGFDTAGRAKSRTDELGRTTLAEFDPLGRLTATIDALGQRHSVAYDSVGRLLSWTDPLGNLTSYAHDSLGRRTSRTLPGGQTESMTWDSLNRLQTHTDFNGHTTTFVYDAEDQLLEKIADPGHPSLTLPHAAAKHVFTYNSFGLPATATVRSASGAVLHSQTWTYDAEGQLTGISTPHGTLSYSHDALGRIQSLASSHPEVPQLNYGTDLAGRLNQISDVRNAPAKTSQLGYNLSGALTSVTHPTGMTHTYQRTNRNFISNLDIADGSGVLESFGYTLNAAGQRTQAVEANGRTVSYQRDALSRLTQESILPPANPVPGVIDYTLNGNGYRTARTSTQPGVSTLNTAVNANGQLKNATYDANGNTLTANGNADIYDFGNRLIRRTKSDGTVLDYVYSAEGQRVEKRKTPPSAAQTEITGYLIDPANPSGWPQCVAEVQPNSLGGWTAHTTYTYGPHGPISQWKAGQGEHQFLLDAHGTVRGLVDANGNVAHGLRRLRRAALRPSPRQPNHQSWLQWRVFRLRPRPHLPAGPLV